jgi:hypothetical protein
MKSLPIKIFLHSAGIVLLVTALAKLISSFGGDRVLQLPDPIFGLPFRYVFFGAGVAELVVAGFCFLGKQVALRIKLVASLTTNFAVYRLGLVWLGYHKPCSCMGNFTGMLHISPEVADNVMKIILIYLLAGSYGSLFWLWRQQNSVSTALFAK